MAFTLEALAVGLLYQRGLRNLVLADLVFWLGLGIPLVLVCYRGFIGMGWEATLLIALKQPLNGLFNALLAGLAILAAQLYWRGDQQRSVGKAGLPSLLFHVLLTSILIAGAVPVIVESYSQRLQLEQRGLRMFAFLAGLLAFGILTARFLSQRLTEPLSKLERISQDLSSEIARGIQPQIPDRPIAEYDGLGNSLREMVLAARRARSRIARFQCGFVQCGRRDYGCHRSKGEHCSFQSCCRTRNGLQSRRHRGQTDLGISGASGRAWAR
ncbi:hypothetical protein BKP64_05355 [Marinobacter salinus]|uniref:HAMP domain-containing protein n=1 Tax=Marinobacter salinus TaxID=1874317 RepID=A0A1D9GJD3_9GAMM|nr:hypothetical protein BKP64_05355 [Marinobacter salinus]